MRVRRLRSRIFFHCNLLESIHLCKLRMPPPHHCSFFTSFQRDRIPKLGGEGVMQEKDGGSDWPVLKVRCSFSWK